MWERFNGDYKKKECYIFTNLGCVIGPCWPNADTFHLMDGSGIIVKADDCLAIRYINDWEEILSTTVISLKGEKCLMTTNT